MTTANMVITFTRMEDPKQAYCEDCNEFGVWWLVDDNNQTCFICQKHADEMEKQANEVHVNCEWLD